MKYPFQDFKKEFPNADACLDRIVALRYGERPECPSCGKVSKLHRIAGRRAYACQHCGHHVYPCVGTPFEKSSTALTLWFHAMYLMTATRNGVAAKELERQLGVTYKTAWRVGHELRKLMADGFSKVTKPTPLTGHIEVDETYIGGVQKGKQTRATRNKTIVMGVLQRDGEVRTKIVKDVKRDTLIKVVTRHVEQGATVSTDELLSYRTLPAHGYKHGTVRHSSWQWLNGVHHTNSIEGFWSILKRGIRSTHVHVSRKYLQNYANEFAFRYNNRKAGGDMFNVMLAKSSGK